jgi:hypothetical protein
VNTQLVKNIVILGQLAQVLPVKNTVPIARVIPGQKFEPDLYHSSPDAEPPVKLTVCIVLGSRGAKDDDVKVFGD